MGPRSLPKIDERDLHKRRSWQRCWVTFPLRTCSACDTVVSEDRYKARKGITSGQSDDTCLVNFRDCLVHWKRIQSSIESNVGLFAKEGGCNYNLACQLRF